MVERLNKEALAGLFFREVEKLAQNEELEGQGKTEALYRLLTLLFIELTRRERLQFSCARNASDQRMSPSRRTTWLSWWASW